MLDEMTIRKEILHCCTQGLHEVSFGSYSQQLWMCARSKMLLTSVRQSGSRRTTSFSSSALLKAWLQMYKPLLQFIDVLVRL